jgi:penicillin-binding protein 1A
MLEGVVQRGTGRTVASVGVPLAGKTGTTNDERDAWFVGFSPNLAVGVFVGFDEPKPMGKGETGGGVAAPIFRDFMQAAIGDEPGVPFRIPPGVNLVRVNAKTGQIAQPGDDNVILEAFRDGTEPSAPEAEPYSAIGGEGVYSEGQPDVSLGAGTGGLY